MNESTEAFLDRPRGVLSPKERRHLLGELDEDPEEDADAIRQRNYRIRQHIRHALLDFRLLALSAPNDVGKVFDEINDPEGEGLESQLAESIQHLFEFLYVHLGAPGATEENVFRTLVQEGVTDALVRLHAKEGMSVHPEVILAFALGEQVPLDDVAETFDDVELILPVEYDALYWGQTTPKSSVVKHRNALADVFQEYLDRGDGETLEQRLAERRERRKEIAVEIDEWLTEAVGLDDLE